VIPIGDLLKKNRHGQVEFLCPKCRILCDFDAPNSMNVWYCHNCSLTLYYPDRNFLEVLIEYEEKRRAHPNYEV
jgi:hypothetical protein